MDQYDKKIIAELRKNGRITVTELANRVGLSKTPCINRMKRLEKTKHILGYTAIIDPVKQGVGQIAFVQVTLSDTRSKALDEFSEAVRQVPEITQCHMIASSFDYLLKIRTRDVNTFRITLGEQISSLPYVAQTSTFVVIEAVKDIGQN